MSINEKINTLNEMQKRGVLTTEGPLLLLAGAGSGKTRVLTHRIAYLLENGVSPYNILAITFTNKAAREMKERVSAITEDGDKVWVSTFHSTCVKLLRRDIDKLGYQNQFSIYDSDDSERLIKEILKELNVSDKIYPPKFVISTISAQKDKMISVNDYYKLTENDFKMKKVAQIYEIYQKRLKDNNALDFDDLIYNTVDLLRHRPDVLDKYQEKFKYIMVDEYQDTNGSQYQLVKLLAGKYQNICVVGDDDQSIYGWRGADISNILGFKDDYANANVFKLEQNYRSTQIILDAANAVISHNYHDELKSLWSDKKDGEKITVYRAADDRTEASYICTKITEGIKSGKEYRDFAVLYRSNALSRAVEEQFVKSSIPYRLFGGTRFYDRKEIRDIMSYLKALFNPNDDVAIKRIINVPKRSIGLTTIGKITQYAAENNMSFYMALCGIAQIGGITTRARNSIEAFVDMMNGFIQCVDDCSIAEFISKIYVESGYEQELKADDTDITKGRIENVEELINKATEFENNNEDATLDIFLEEIALVADVDGFTENDDTVILMTLHSSKGLEFDTVFLPGFEENLFPSYMSIVDANRDAIQEERRLCYVGITRAKKKLYLLSAGRRLQHGNYVSNDFSRFLKEIPNELISRVDEVVKKSKVAPVDKGYTNVPKYNLKRQVSSYKMPEPTNINLNYEIGDKIRHFKFGAGTVAGIEPAGADYEVTVEFDNVGTKKLMAKLAKLKKI